MREDRDRAAMKEQVHLLLVHFESRVFRILSQHPTVHSNGFQCVESRNRLQSSQDAQFSNSKHEYRRDPSLPEVLSKFRLSWPIRPIGFEPTLAKSRTWAPHSLPRPRNSLRERIVFSDFSKILLLSAYTIRRRATSWIVILRELSKFEESSISFLHCMERNSA